MNDPLMEAAPEQPTLLKLRRYLAAFWQILHAEAATTLPLLPLLRALKVVAALPLRAEQRLLTAQPAVQRYLIAPGLPASREYLHFRGYLSSALTMRRRIDCLISHFGHEGRSRLPSHLEHLYLQQGVLTLWREQPLGTGLEINLSHPREYRMEGELSLTLMLEDRLITTLSFTYIDSATVGLPGHGICPFLACVQTTADAADRARFVQHQPEHLPRLLLRAALVGLCEADGLRGMIGIPGEQQINFRADQREIFLNAYDRFWHENHDGRSAQGYWIPLPLHLPDVGALPAKRRARARRRREYWQAISRTASNSLSAHSRAAAAAAAQVG